MIVTVTSTLRAVLQQPPTRMRFARLRQSKRHVRWLGTCPNTIVEILGAPRIQRLTCLTVVAADARSGASVSTQILALLLVAANPAWGDSSTWLAASLRWFAATPSDDPTQRAVRSVVTHDLRVQLSYWRASGRLLLRIEAAP